MPVGPHAAMMIIEGLFAPLARSPIRLHVFEDDRPGLRNRLAQWVGLEAIVYPLAQTSVGHRVSSRAPILLPARNRSGAGDASASRTSPRAARDAKLWGESAIGKR